MPKYRYKLSAILLLLAVLCNCGGVLFLFKHEMPVIMRCFNKSTEKQTVACLHCLNSGANDLCGLTKSAAKKSVEKTGVSKKVAFVACGTETRVTLVPVWKNIAPKPALKELFNFSPLYELVFVSEIFNAQDFPQTVFNPPEV